jgi:hypothetical protein
MPKQNDQTTRDLTIREARAAAATYDPEARTIRAIATTEAPTQVIDWDRWELIDEILRMDGLRMPDSGQVPLLDSHNRSRVGDVIGSARDFSAADVSGYAARECTVVFADTEAGRDAEIKYRDGHITDFSIGYRVTDATYIPENEKQVIGGVEYAGPVRVATKWELKELSATPIGADEYAKARTYNHGDHTMNKDTQKKVEAPAQSETRTEQVGIDPAEAERIASLAVETERKRMTEIRDAVRMIGLDGSVADELIASGCSVDEARAQVLARFAENNPPLQTPSVESGKTERDKFRAAVVDGLCARHGVGEQSNEFRGRSLVQIAEESLRRSGISTAGKRNLEIAGMALREGTSDFPYILANTANKVMQKAYTEYPSTYEAWCGISDGSDFKSVSRPQLSEGPDLQLINEDGEYTIGHLSEFAESNQIKTYGKMIRLTRQAIINDDRSAFARIPRLFGAASVRRINDLVYAILISGQTMAYDSTSLFHADHGNLGAADLATSALTAARAAMRVQTGPGGQTLNIMPKYLIVPAALETTAEVILRSASLYESGANSGNVNVWRNQLIPVIEPRIDATDADSWYLAADSNQIDTVEVMFLDGVRTPYMDEEVEFNTDALVMKARIDVGARALDHRGLYKSAGA